MTEHVKCHDWLRRYRDRFVERCHVLTAQQLDELVTLEAYVDLAGELGPEIAADLEIDDFFKAGLARD